jgi:non-ribosomal peptide synthetase component F
MTDIHHIISDGTSVGILVNELLLLYEERELCCWQFQYKDFSAWQQRLYESSEIKKQEQYWLDIFAGDIPILDLPTDFPRPQVQQFRGNTIPFEINKELTAEIKQLVSNTKATLFMVLLAIFNITLTKYTGQEDIVVGTPISGRNHAGLEQIIGMFVNMLALRNRPGSNQTFMEFLLEVKHNVLEAFENQDYPFDELVSKLNIQGASNRNPLFDTAVALQNIDTLQVKGVAPPTDYGSCNENNGSHYSNIDNRGAKEHRQLKVFPYQYERTTAKFDLLLVAVEADAVISMSMEYSTELFTPLTIEKITTYYLEILAQVVKDTDIKIKDITLSHHFQEIKSPELKESRHEFKF